MMNEVFIPQLEGDLPNADDIKAWDVIFGRMYQVNACAIGNRMFVQSQHETRHEFIERVIEGTNYQATIMRNTNGESV